MFKGRRVLALALVLILTMSTIAFAAPSENAAIAFDQKMLTKLDTEKAFEHIKYLTEEIGVRVATSEEEREAAEYIKSVFEDYGYDAKIQEFAYYSGEAELFIGDNQMEAFAGSGKRFTGYKEVSGKLVDCGLGLLEEEFPDEVEGNIALIQRGSAYGITGYFSVKAKMAQEAGAVGVIIYSTDNNPFGPSLQEEAIDIPTVMISKDDGEALLAEMEEGIVEATLNIIPIPSYSQNVVAVKDATNKKSNGIIYVTAHYDTVPGAPGANDNASGVAMMLEYARILKKLPTDKEVRFIACGAEEVGLEGSFVYVENLSQEEIDRSIGVFNMDMIATGYEPCNIFIVNTVDGEPNYISDLAVAAGARLGSDYDMIAEYGISSDHRYFGYKGIPHGGFIWRQPNGLLEPYYHEPEDTIEINFSMEKFEESGRIIGAALYQALRKETPALEKRMIKEFKPMPVKKGEELE